MKTIVICCDGTWNTSKQKEQGKWTPTNVTLMSKSITSNEQQLVYYDAGLGTDGWLDKFSGGVFGFGLFKNIQQAYCYIVKHYQEGDKLVFLGFSRGAYTVRSLAGLITKVGLLKSDHLSKFQTALDFYRNTTIDKEKVKKYSQEFCHPSKEVFFVGVWDTIGSLGIPLNSFNWLTRWYYKFHNTELSAEVVYGYHALAIDEKRRSFKPVLWSNKEWSNKEWSNMHNLSSQIIEQRWFVGVHSNIGGGYADTGLSDLSFNWIKTKLQEAIPELIFNQQFLELHIKPDYKAKIANSLTWFFPISRLLPIQRKPLQYHAINEIIDTTVKERQDCKECDYYPKNIA